MAKRSPRLIFTEEERALPELERAVRKADRAAVKLEKAEAKIPKKTVKVKKRVVDSESGKVTTRLFFEEADAICPRIASTGISTPIKTIVSIRLSISLQLFACPVEMLPSWPVFIAFIWTPYVPIMQKYNICT